MILRFIPGGDEEKTSYINLYSYLNSRARCGVVGNKAKHIKDFYILPLASHSQIPSILTPFDGPGKNYPSILTLFDSQGKFYLSMPTPVDNQG